MVSYRQYPESLRHNRTYDELAKTYCFEIDPLLLFFVHIASTTGINMAKKDKELLINQIIIKYLVVYTFLMENSK